MGSDATAPLPSLDEAGTAREKARFLKARTHLVLDRPFWGHLALRLGLKADATCDTAWTDGVSIGFNAGYVATLQDAELKGLVAHEVAHVALGHCWRRGTRDQGDWNRACDYAINQALVDDGFKLPGEILLDDAYKGMCAEQIYQKIHKPKPKGGSGGNGRDDQPQSQQQPQQSGAGQNGQQSNQQGQAQQGQANGPGQPSSSPKMGPGEVRDLPTDADKGKTEQEWKEAVQQAAQAARMAGTLPLGADLFVGEAKRPSVDWTEALWQFVERSWQSSEMTWKRPNMRYLSQGLYLPSSQSTRMPSFVIGLDTSGSVLGPLLTAFKGELESLIAMIRPEEAYLVHCDAKVQKVDEIESGQDFELKAKGGGGTRFGPVFDWIEKEGHTPACLVFFTDLEGSFPEKEPDYPVLWITPPTHHRPPWGDHVEMRL